MRRFALPLVIVGSIAILVALVLLLRSITHEAPAATATATAKPRDPWSGPTPQSSPSTGAARSAPMVPQILRPRSDDSPRTEPAEAPGTPSLNVEEGPAGQATTKGMQYGLPQIREKVSGNRAKVLACIGQYKPTGVAMLTFVVAKRAGKYIVEQVDIDHEQTTLKDEQLVDCLSKTALAMEFEGLPRDSSAIIVTRSITLQDGAVVEDWPLKFSYL